MRIAMIGGGYVGLVSGACLADIGHSVCVIETDTQRFAALCEGRIPIYEPGLDAIVARNTQAGRLRFNNHLVTELNGADAVFLAVGTPSRRGDGHADLTYVFSAAEQIAAALKQSTVLVTKSTVPVGTGRKLAARMAELRPDIRIDIASNPEFLREGSAIEDFMRPDRVVIGAETHHAREVLRRIYRPMALDEAALLFTGIESAELIKYSANAFMAMKISFINEIADLCEKVSANVLDVAHGMGLDQRIGSRFLTPGPGYGGSCFPKDTQALMRIAQEAGAPLRLVETVVGVNEARKAGMAGRIIARCGGSVRGKRIAVLGLTFKPGTDDMREAPSIDIVHRLIAEGAQVHAFDPVGMLQAQKLLPDTVHYSRDVHEAVEDADALVVLTEWDAFRALSPQWLRQTMRGTVVVDLRNIFDTQAMAKVGFAYHSIGRPAGKPRAADTTIHTGNRPVFAFADA
ncbi:UDP-glucose/GDP-mannose dehydrogenase family protein [Oleiagrimonas sp.]|jgi:UDPglucose 6-dehydrogenase|uniref:UDP-glucose dehydrogenase family protein n=1 Tax=Oleiagrimonas sp. TaxID=2010330 RepID=UPI0026208B3A|nr:UDP-glucose/GDP-mannose dehydrogenase family protein [Oleiagrimonas sp.]MDA3913548.1 UDP-glucose/GDP-mannose dehydrogenase family protein [Oleiagrimonas sp.]